MRADFRDIWAGRETSDTGKQADPEGRVALDFNTTIDPARVAAQFVPVATNGTCGSAVPLSLVMPVTGAGTWSKTLSNGTRPTLPAPYNVFVRHSVAGVPSVAGAVAAGGDASLASFGLNGVAQQTFGLIAGGRVDLVNGSITGNLSYGVPSTIPGTVSVSGQKSQQPFDVEPAFRALEALSTLLRAQTSSGTVSNQSGALRLSGTKPGVNVFRLTSDALRQASSVQVNVPTGAGAVIDVTGDGVAIQNKSIVLQGATASTLLWNLSDASLLQVSSIALPGSLLAPRASLSFASGSVSGTVVARSLTSPGSGSLLHAPLNANVVFPATAPSSVELKALRPLVRGCTYEFVLPSTQPLTAGGNCLTSPVRVRFRVANHPSTPAMRELQDAVVELRTNTLRRFIARSGINTPADAVWSRYQSLLGGVLPSSIVRVGPARPNSTRSGQLLRAYQQTHQGYPVFGFGYAVATEGDIFRDANGKLMPNLPNAPSAVVSETAALNAALAFLRITNPPWITNPAGRHAPVASLGWMARRPDPTPADFLLVWDLRFAGTGVSEPAGVEVEAATGRVLGSDSALLRQNFLDPAATYVNQEPNGLVQTENDGNQSITLALYRQPTGQTVTTLATNAHTAQGTFSAMFQAPPPAGLESLRLVTNPSSTWSAATGAAQRAMATGYWGLLRANAFLPSLELQFGTPSPWTTVDGTGRQQVTIAWRDGYPGAITGYHSIESDPNRAFISLINPVDRTTMPHEYAHLLLANARRALGLVPDIVYRGESGSLLEGISDLFAIATIRKQPPLPANWQCILDANVCNRDLENPLRTTPALPDFYKGPQYGIYTDVTNCPDSDACFVHSNATVIGHWGYLLAFSSRNSPPNPCNLTVEPLAPDPDTALKMLLNIMFYAASSRLGLVGSIVEPTFADFREATILVARSLVTERGYPPDTPKKVEAAWYAVGVGPDFLGGFSGLTPVADSVTPPDHATSVNPWQTFAWPLGNAGSAARWDFQIADGPFETSLKLEKKDVQVDVIVDDQGTELATLPLALPSNSLKGYFWRVRPHSSAPWLACDPVHSFFGTIDPDPLERVFVNQESMASVPPGEGLLFLGGVRNAVAYDVGVSSQDSNCDANHDVFDATIPTPVGERDEDSLVFRSVHGLEPSEQYWIEARAVGPNDFAGNPSFGACTERSFDTTPLPAPTQLGITSEASPFFPGLGVVVDIRKGPQLGFTVHGGTESTLLSFFERDESGACATSSAATKTVDTLCPETDSCVVCNVCRQPSVETTVTARPHPGGYCWDATAIAENGMRSSASEKSQFLYSDQVKSLSPGVPLLAAETGTPSPLPGDSWGSDVTLSWEADPLALSYRVRLSRWPDALELKDPSLPLDPPSCLENRVPLGIDDCRRPRNVIHESVVTGTTLALNGALAGRGRYCWTVWPLYADPRAPGTVGGPQPRVYVEPFCYTSGPAEPSIVMDPPEPPGGYPAGTPIKGRIILPYVPGGQYDVLVDSEHFSEVDFGEFCEPNGVPLKYVDFYDCEVPFTIADPKPGNPYSIFVRTWNYDSFPPPKEESDVIHEVSRDIHVACGGLDEACCPGEGEEQCGFPTDGRFLSCQSGKCAECGGRFQACCPVPSTLGNNMPCPTAGFLTNNGTPGFGRCVDNQCVPCGLNGEECCENAAFIPPIFICAQGNTCSGIKGACHADNNPPPAGCNQMIHEGGNAPETHTIDMHKTSGVFTFFLNTFEIPDRMVVTYQGQILFNTDCIATEAFPMACSIFGICCDGAGNCSVPLQYAGNSSTMTVTVMPNCAGTPDTGWQFALSCPP